MPGSTDIGNHGDNAVTNITLPFPLTFYGSSYTSANVSSNGNLQFVSATAALANYCLPATVFDSVILPFWDDLRTDTNLSGCADFASGCGIFTSISGNAPNRIFNIEWRAMYYLPPHTSVNFEVRLYEGTGQIDFVYGNLNDTGSATVGLQNGSGWPNTQFECNTGGLSTGLLLTFMQLQCPTATLSPTDTPTHTSTPSATTTPTYTSTETRTVTPTFTPTYTPEPDIIVGHLTWQGIPQPNSHNSDFTGTLTLCAANVPYSYTITTDADGSFTVGTGLPDGTYGWWFKGPRSLATSGVITLSTTTSQEFGIQRAGDVNNNNLVEGQDFSALRNSFGKQPGEVGYDPRTDFNNDRICNALDYSLQKTNFGQAGATPGCSGP